MSFITDITDNLKAGGCGVNEALAAVQAAEVAKSSGVSNLLIGHFSARYSELDGLLDEAKSVFSQTELAIEGKEFEIK